MGHTGGFELLVMLAILRLGDDAYGVTIRDELEKETSRTFSLGAIYKTLGRLEAKGHVRTRVAPPTGERGGRRKKMYEVTPAGSDAAKRTLSDVRGMARGLDPEMGVP